MICELARGRQPEGHTSAATSRAESLPVLTWGLRSQSLASPGSIRAASQAKPVYSLQLHPYFLAKLR